MNTLTQKPLDDLIEDKVSTLISEGVNLDGFNVEIYVEDTEIGGDGLTPETRLRNLSAGSGTGGNVTVINDYTGQFRPEDYGTISNGEEASAAFTAMIAAMPSRGGQVVLGARDYLINNSVVVNKPCIIGGKGGNNVQFTNATTLIKSTANNIHVFEFAAPNITIKDLSIENIVGSTPASGSGIYVTNGNPGNGTIFPSGYRFRDISVRGFYDNINILNGYQWKMDGCLIYSPVRYGMLVRNSALPDGGDACISNTDFYASVYNSSTGIRYESGGGLKMNNCKFNMGVDGNKFQYFFFMNFQAHSVDLLINNCSFENALDQSIVIRTPNSNSFANIIINGNQFAPSAATDNMIDMDGAGGLLEGVMISGNTFNAIYSSERAIRIANAKDVTIGYNNYRGASFTADDYVNITNLNKTPTTGINV